MRLPSEFHTTPPHPARWWAAALLSIACTPAATLHTETANSRASIASDNKDLAVPMSSRIDTDWVRPQAPHNSSLTRSAKQALAYKLRALSEFHGFALGHQDSTAYGVGFRGEEDRSDVADVCGSHVGVYGWDAFRIERGARKNGDGVNFARLQTLMRAAHEAGGINTLSWHVDNPLTGNDAWDNTPAVSAALPGGSRHQVYVGYLSRLAEYLDSLRGKENERLPIVMRLFHEHNGDWFWWGSQNDEDDYRELLRFSIEFLIDKRKLDNLLFAFSPDGGRIRAASDLTYGYPGDELIDLLGIDYYLDPGSDRLLELTRWLVELAQERGKYAALTEFGPRDGIDGSHVPVDFLSRRIISPLLNSDAGPKLSYVLAWRNDRPDHAFLPYPGHPAQSDLRTICERSEIILSRDMGRFGPPPVKTTTEP